MANRKRLVPSYTQRTRMSEARRRAQAARTVRQLSDAYAYDAQVTLVSTGPPRPPSMQRLPHHAQPPYSVQAEHDVCCAQSVQFCGTHDWQPAPNAGPLGPPVRHELSVAHQPHSGCLAH